MIKTPTQLKALVKNHTHSDSGKAQLWFRNYAMERFLERISLSKYRDSFILKGGMLISSMVGIANRTTMDIDTTIRNFPLDPDTTLKIVQEISNIPLDDNMRFEIIKVSRIMEEANYPGVRISMNAFLSNMRISLMIDVSTDDVITPSEVLHRHKLMFEDRSIQIWAYNIETVLAEKIETLISRGALSTRMRDFYDIYILQNSGLDINSQTLRDALIATSKKRGHYEKLFHYQDALIDICESPAMKTLWNRYRADNNFAADLDWKTVCDAACNLCDSSIPLIIANHQLLVELQKGIDAGENNGWISEEEAEDLLDLEAYNKAHAAYLADPVTYTFDEVKQMLELDDEIMQKLQEAEREAELTEQRHSADDIRRSIHDELEIV